jgi:Flp pilus assembly protein TadB
LSSLPTGPRRLVVGSSFLAGYGLVYVLLVLVGSKVFGHPPDWTRPLGPMIGAALGSGLAAWWRRRRMGSSEQVREFTRAVRARRLPEGADPDVWAPLLTRERRALRRGRAIVLPLTALVFAAVAGSAVVVGFGVTGAVSALVAGTVLFSVLWLVSRRTAARIDALSDQLPGAARRD